MDMDKKNITPDKKVAKLLKGWQTNRERIDKITSDFKQLDMITNAQYDGITNKTNVGDTTVAGIVRLIMRAAVKVLPHVSVAINGSTSTVESIICRNRVEKVLLNPTTFGKGLVSILQLGGRGALSRGFNVFQITSKKMYGKFGVVPKLIHYNDFAIEPVQDGSQSGKFWIRTKMSPDKLQDIYDRESKKKKGKSTWNIPALKALLDAGPDGDGAGDYAEFVTPSEQSKIEAGSETYDIITCYSANEDDDIITFAPAINQPLRTVPNNSKFGYPRTLFLVIDPAELSAFGDSRTRLASPNQNLLMALRQNVATTWMYNSKPAMVQTGLFTGATKLKSGGVIKSTDPNSKITLLTLDTATSQQYPTISQEITKQIQNMMGMNPGQALGAIGESKTGTGAQAQKQGIDDSIQQITNIMEEFLCQYIISGLDLYLSEQEGESVIYVDDATREDILRVDPNAFPDPANPNALKVDWQALYDYIEEIDAMVDTTISKQDWTDEKRGELQDAVTVMSQTADPNDPVAQERKRIVEDKYLDETSPELSRSMREVSAQIQTPMTQQESLTALEQ